MTVAPVMGEMLAKLAVINILWVVNELFLCHFHRKLFCS
jgi:hypothetical protein